MNNVDRDRGHINLGNAPAQMSQHEASAAVYTNFYDKLRTYEIESEQPFVYLDNGLRLIDKEAILRASSEPPREPHLPQINEWYVDDKDIVRDRHYLFSDLFSDENTLCIITGGSVKIIDPKKPEPYTIHRGETILEEVSAERCLDLLGKILAGQSLGNITTAEWTKHWLDTLPPPETS